MTNNLTFSLNRISYFFWQFIKLGVAALALTYVFTHATAGRLGALGLALRVDLWPIVPIGALLIYGAFRIPGRLGELLAFVFTLLLFALPLVGLWAYGGTQTSVISGLIQVNDARGYYANALSLINGESFSYFSSRRPLFPSFLAFLLVLTHVNLMATLAILSVITGLACYFLTREFQRTHGTETAVFLLMLVFLYYRLHSGITMSENFGIALGSLGFLILWRGTAHKNLTLLSFGIYTTTLALNARAGAFLILPLLVIFTGWLFRASKKELWKGIVLSSLAIVLGFASGLLLGRIIGRPGSIPFANFSFSLYSLAAGGKSWAYIAEVHPEVLTLKDPELTRRVFQWSFELMREKPFQIVEGALFFWKAIFTDTLYNVFAFVAKENWVIHPAIKWALYLLSLLGIYACFKARKAPTHLLVLICILGVFLSIPLAPPTDSFRMRPYAASMAIINLLPALGFGYFIQKIKLISYPAPTSEQFSLQAPIYFNVALICFMLVPSILIKYAAHPPILTPQACASNSQPIAIYFAQGSYINVLKNKSEFTDGAPNFHIYIFQRNAHGLENAHLISWLETIRPATTMLISVDLLNQRGLWILFPTELLPKENGYVQFCGRFETDPNLANYAIFYADEVIPILTK
ncbi:MAG: hypothetical protein IT310_12100 [Anaerolineales bacterium]|nr:hypothetical protein [Anaerolineales bacterium]